MHAEQCVFVWGCVLTENDPPIGCWSCFKKPNMYSQRLSTNRALWMPHYPPPLSFDKSSSSTCVCTQGRTAVLRKGFVASVILYWLPGDNLIHDKECDKHHQCEGKTVVDGGLRWEGEGTVAVVHVGFVHSDAAKNPMNFATCLSCLDHLVFSFISFKMYAAAISWLRHFSDIVIRPTIHWKENSFNNINSANWSARSHDHKTKNTHCNHCGIQRS